MQTKYFEDLEVWRLSRNLTNQVYKITKEKGFSKDFGLIEQIRRSAVSIISNIAEGFERGGNKEFIQYLYVAKGSCGELRSQLYVAFDQNYITRQTLKEMIELAKIVSIKLNNLIQALKASNLKGSKYNYP
jgi:four helix bundle protein